MENTIEFSVVGTEIEEHFDNYENAESFLSELSNEEQMDVQFFSKEWEGIEEAEVIIFKNYGEHF